jgi:glycosyltransferase involved in cell wall biosynthesis
VSTRRGGDAEPLELKIAVDVLLPYYGPVDLMQLAVRSVLDQEFTDWVLTVVDDGYPDPGIAEWFAGLGDPRVHYHRNEQNLGANGNYRKALTFVQHEYVVMMGADDVMLPNYLSTVVAALDAHPDAAFAQPGVEVIDENGNQAGGLVDRAKALYTARGSGVRVLGGEQLATSLLRGNWLYFPSICWRAGAITRTGFREGLDVVQDLALALDIIRGGGGLVVDDTVCFRYRRHRSSDSSWRALEGSRFTEERRFFSQVAEEMSRHGWPRAARAARLHLSSRINAATLLPRAARRQRWSGVRTLARHAFGS